MPVAGKTPVGESPEKLNRKKGRNENMKRRFWAGLLSFVMLWSLLPASALATNEEKPAAEAAMTLTKNVSEPSADGTYTITMEAQATGKESTVTTQEPMDIVLVLDVSGSMKETIPSRYEEVKAEDVKRDGTYYVRVKHSFLFWSWDGYDKVTYCEKCGAFTDGCGKLFHVIKGEKYDHNETTFYVETAEVVKLDALKTAVNGFIDSVKANSEKSSIAVVSFASEANNISSDLLPVKDKADDLKNAVKGLTADGATRADLGMQQAAEIMKTGTHAKKIVVMFTDGEPTSRNSFEDEVANDAIQAAKGMKNAGTQVFTVGVFDKASEKTTNYMNYVSSNYPKAESMEKPGNGSAEAGYYMTADDADGLNTIFKTISESITAPTNEKLNTETVVEDTLSEYFTFDTDTPATGSVKVYAKAKDGTQTDSAKDAKAKVDGQKVTVTGYNFAEHFKGSPKEETLVIEITVKPSGVGCATAAIPTNADDNSNYAAKATLNSTVVASAESATVTGCYVEYDLDGGTGDVPGKLYYPKYAEVSVTDAKPEKADHDFTGWKNGENPVSSGVTVEVLSDVTLIAQWSPKQATTHTVTYHANNGVTPDTYTDTFAAGAQVTARGSANDVGTSSVTLPNSVSFECSDKKFKGWANSDGTVKYAPEAEITNAIARNYDLYAVWETSTPARDKYKLTYNTGSYGSLPGAVNSKEDPTEYDAGTTAYVKYDNDEYKVTPDSAITPKILFLGWTDKSSSLDKIYKLGDEIPTLVTEVKMSGDKAVYAVYGEDANHDGTPDVYQAKVTYRVENGYWTTNQDDVRLDEIVVWFNLYEKQNGTWQQVTSAPTLGDTVPVGHSDKPGYTGAGWFMDNSTTVMENGPDSTTQVNKPETLYTFKYVDASHKYDVYDVLNSLVYKDFQSRYGENTTAEFTVTATMRAGTLLPLPDTEEVKPEGTEITGKVSISTKDQPKAFVFERPLGYMNPEDGDYFVEVTETDDGTANVTCDHRTFLIAFCIKDGAVNQEKIQIGYFADNELTSAENATFVNTYTQKTTSHDDDSDTYYYVVKKVDAQDGHALKGAKFGLYVDDKQIATAISSSEGYALFSLDERVYNRLDKDDEIYYTELTAPDGYIKSSREYTVSVDNFVKNSVLSAKRDADTVKNSSSSAPDRLNDEEHFAYVIGYKDGNVRPYGLISRAETTTIFFRLLKDSVRDGNLLTSNTYTDVADNYWANTAISTMTGLGIVQGRTATTFDPYAPITRAQFAAICARFDTGKSSGTQSFTDIKGHWAEKYIERAAELGWIKGFEDGTFRPDTYITRAQAMTMINRVLNRIPEDADDLLSNMNVWPDCNPGDWFYLAVHEATNSHDYKHKAGNYETWSSMNKDPDWTRYEN